MRWSQLTGAWNSFWFEPKSCLTIAVYRILYGLVVLECALQLAPQLQMWYGNHGVVSRSTQAEYLQQRPFLDLLALLPPGELPLTIFFVLFVLASVFLTVGLFTRTSAFVVFLALVSLHHHNSFNLNSGDVLLRVSAFLLSFSQAGYSLSVDNWIRKRRSVEVDLRSPWAQRLLQITLCSVYCQSFLVKIAGPMWLDGTAVYYASRLQDYQRFGIPFVFEHLWTIKALTWFTLLVELCMWTLVWIKECRYWVLLAAAIFHLGLDWTMSLSIFEHLMLVSLLLFVEPDDLRHVASRLKDVLVRRRETKTAAA